MTPRLYQNEKNAAKYQKSIKCMRRLLYKYGSKDELKKLRKKYRSNENDTVLRQAYTDYRKYRHYEKTVDKLKEKITLPDDIERCVPQDVLTRRSQVAQVCASVENGNESQSVSVDTTERTRNRRDVSESFTNGPNDTSDQIYITEDQSTQDERFDDEITFLVGCANCRRRQSNELIAEHGNVAPYFISFARYVRIESMYYF